MTRRRCSRFASAKVRLFYKPAKGWERFFKKKAKKRGRKGDKWREEGGDTLLYYIYRGAMKNGKRKTENGKLTAPLRRVAPRPLT